MKKAYINMHVLFALIIGVLVLGIMVFFLTTSGREFISDKFGRILPGFNANKTLQSQYEIIRYDISQDKLEWYDGSTFHDFGNGQVGINNKILVENSLKQDFSYRYYFNDGLLQEKTFEINPSLELGKNLYPTIKTQTENLEQTYNLVPSQTQGRGDIFLNSEYTNIYVLALPNQRLIYYDSSPGIQIGSVQDGKITITSLSGINDAKVTNTASYLSGKIYTDLVDGKIHPTTENYLQLCAETDKGNKVEINRETNKETVIILREFENNQCLTDKNIYGVFYSRLSPKQVYFYELGAFTNGAQTISSNSVEITTTRPEITNEIISITMQWRDEVLKIPITLNYEENSTRISQKFCAQKFDNKYLVVDLKSPTFSSQCP